MVLKTAVIGFCLRALKISEASSGTPSTLPPGESTSNTMALQLPSPKAWRNCAVSC